MKIGDAVRVSSIRALMIPKGWVEYKAGKGQAFVVSIIGIEPRDGSDPIDPQVVMQRLGWTPVAKVTEAELGLQAIAEGHDAVLEWAHERGLEVPRVYADDVLKWAASQVLKRI